MRAFLDRIFGPMGVRERGRPPSPNGASSFHLAWSPPVGDFDAVRATLTVPKLPTTSDLYFFALQASFMEGGVARGGAHVGLQWNARHPGSTAVNWGGYESQATGGAVLGGTESPLPSRPNDPNTRDYPWRAGVPYELRIEPGRETGSWLGSVTDLDRMETTPIRELMAGGSTLGSPLVWCEVFARCDAPSVTATWHGLAARDPGGGWHEVRTVSTRYQDYAAGGCTNTSSATDGARFIQSTATPRQVAAFETLSLNP